MANAHSFPLLRLPSLAREHVVKVMDVREQFLFATLSKKSEIVARNGVGRLSYSFRWVLSLERISMEIKKHGTDNWFAIFIYPLNATNVLPENLDRTCRKVENPEEHAIAFLKFLNDVFKSSDSILKIIYAPTDFAKQFLVTVRNLKIGIDSLEVYCDSAENEMFELVMENGHKAKQLLNLCETTGDFQWDSQEPFTNETLVLRNAPWLTMNQLTRLFINCKLFQVCYNQHQLTVEDLNQLVKMWMNGSTMECFEIRISETFDFAQIMQDIEKEPVEHVYIEDDLQTFEAGQAFKIRKTSGEEALVSRDEYDFRITTRFDDPTEEDLVDDEEDFEDEDEVENAE